jgi:hypothetical protein
MKCGIHSEILFSSVLPSHRPMLLLLLLAIFRIDIFSYVIVFVTCCIFTEQQLLMLQTCLSVTVVMY